MNNFIFIGQFVSQNDSYKDKRISQAGNNYQLKFVELLNPKLIITLLPIFIDISKIDKNFYGKNIKIVAHPFLRGKINYLFRFIADSIKTLFLIKKSKINNIFFYNLDKQNIGIIFFAKFLLKCKVFVIVADFSNYANKSMFDRLCNYVLKKINGAIVFNSNIVVNSCQRVSSGLIKESEIVYKEKSSLNKNVIMSGSLGTTTGLEVVLETFKRKPDWNLYITGRLYKYDENDFINLMQEHNQCENLHYLGLLTYEQYQDILAECDIAISLRNPNDIEHQYNFPSKILEYLSKSKIVISSLVYNDIPNEFLFYSDFNSISLNNVLNQLSFPDKDSINGLKANIYNYLNTHFTQSSLLAICNDLISVKQ